MNAEEFWKVVTGAQVSTALVLIAAALVFIAMRLWDKPRKWLRN